MSTIEYRHQALNVPTPQGLVLFEVYEASGALLLVASTLEDFEPQEGDYIVKRTWSTAADPILHRVVEVLP